MLITSYHTPDIKDYRAEGLQFEGHVGQTVHKPLLELNKPLTEQTFLTLSEGNHLRVNPVTLDLIVI